MPIASPTPETSRERITPQGNRVRVPRGRLSACNGFEYASAAPWPDRQTAVTSAGIPGVMIECKAEKSIDLAGYMAEVAEEKAHADAQIGVAVVKRRNKGVDQAYVVMPLSQFAELLRDEETQ